jgi:hypothetical protein
MSIHWYSFRQGDRTEYLALYMLSALGLAVKVPREEDVGIDFHCTLGKRIDNIISYYAPFNVQVKASSVKELSYGGSNDKGIWKEHEINWILNQRTPFFVAIVDKAAGQMDLFSTATRWFAVHNPSGKLPYELVFRPYTPDENADLHNGQKEPINVETTQGVEAVRWVLPLGQPVLSMTFNRAEDNEFVNMAREIIVQYINIDVQNAVAISNGLQLLLWPLRISTNKPLIQNGMLVQWYSRPTIHTRLQLRSLAPLVASLLRTFELANEGEAVAKLAGFKDLIPPDADLDLIRQIIEVGINKHAAKDELPSKDVPGWP